MDIDRHAVIRLSHAVIDDVKRNGHDCTTTDYFYKLDVLKGKIQKIVESRGTNLLFIDFPFMGKLFDAGLSAGSMNTRVFPPFFRDRSQGSAFASLFSDAVRSDGTFLEDIDPYVVYGIRQVLYLWKKVKIACSPEIIMDSVDEFSRIDHALRLPDGSWSADHWCPNRLRFWDNPVNLDLPRQSRMWDIMDAVCAMVTPAISLNVRDIVPRHGPGAVSDLKGGKDKYTFPSWPHKLGSLFPSEEFAFHSDDHEVIKNSDVVLGSEEVPSRLIAVPKTLTGPRLIASEPTAHQFLQQGLMRWIRRNMNPLCSQSINFVDQGPSRDAALLASKTRTLATVDLSSASDRLSCWTVERVFGSNQTFLAALHATRTRRLVDGTGSDASMDICLKKFAPQGSAVTFPVQSLTYFACCLAAIAYCDANWKPSLRYLRKVGRDVRVFGDDLIVPKRVVPVLAELLKALQLKVNVSKTHDTGKFRESCGMDAYDGCEVTPIYMSAWNTGTSPSHLMSWIDVSNNAHRQGLWELSSLMDRMLGATRKYTITTGTEGDGLRLFTFSNGFVTDAPVKWCKHHHVHKAKVLGLRVRSRAKSRGSWQDLYQWLIEAPRPDSKWTAGYLVKKDEHFTRTWVPLS